MKNLNHLLLACITLMALACTPNQVCIHLPDNSDHCIGDTAAMYWLRQDSGTLKVSKFSNLPRNFGQYPQFGAVTSLANGNYVTDLVGTELVLSLPSGSNNQNGTQVRGDAQFGFFIFKDSLGTKMVSATNLDCDRLYMDITQAGWTVLDEPFGNGIRVSTSEVHVDYDGTRLMKRLVQTHPEVTRHKGTEVVLIDNFRLGRGPSNCCDETCFACCSTMTSSRTMLPTTFTSEHLPTYPGYVQEAMFAVGGTCVSLQCEWLRVADCEKRTVECFNTFVCPADLWINEDLSAGAVYDSACAVGARYRTTCTGTSGGSPIVSNH